MESQCREIIRPKIVDALAAPPPALTRRDVRRGMLPEEWPALSSGYRLEIERMQGEILDYLVQGAPRRSEGATA